MPIPVPLTPLAPPPSKTDIVYGLVSDAIFNGHLQPRERIQIDDIAEAAGCSRTPVLIAVSRLLREGLIVKQNTSVQGAFYVAAVSDAEADEACAALASLLELAVHADRDFARDALERLSALPGCRDATEIDRTRRACLRVADAAPNSGLAYALTCSLETLLYRGAHPGVRALRPERG